MTTIQNRRGTAAQWISSDPVLAAGELGLETDTGKFKFGDGAAAWTLLPYAASATQGFQPVKTFSELQTAVAAGGSVWVDSGSTINITSSINVTVPVTIAGGKFTLPASATYPAFYVTSSDVTFSGGTFAGGTSAAAYSDNARFIYALGASNNYLKNVKVLGCTMTGSQTENIRFTFVRGFTIADNYMDDFLYAGFLGLSVEDGSISNNDIRNAVMKSPVVNVYGIALTDSANTVALRSRNIRVVGNNIYNIPWEGIDTHGGEAITITGNNLKKCVRGIALVVGNETRLTVPNRCVVTGNIVDRDGALDGTTEREGISLFGLSGNLADATITGNEIIGYSAANALYLSIYVDHKRTLIQGNSHPHIPWTDITMDNQTVWTPNATYVPQYMVDGRTVYLRGFATSKGSVTLNNSKIGVLPSICVPERLTFAGASHGSNSAAGLGQLGVYPSGELWMLYKTTSDAYSYPVECSYIREYIGS